MIYLTTILASFIRYYDYALIGIFYGIISKYIFASNISEEYRILIFYTILALSMFIRPFGAIFFGKISDNISRLQSITYSSAIGGISMLLIALMPEAESYNIISFCIFVIARMLFIFSLAGESDNLKILVTEITSPKRKYLFLGVISTISQAGVFVANIAYKISIINDNSQLWRLMFLFGFVISIVIIYIRQKTNIEKKPDILTSKIQKEIQSETHPNHIEDIANNKIISLIKRHKVRFIASAMLRGLIGGLYHSLIIFFVNFLAIYNNQQLTHVISKHQFIIINYSLSAILFGYLFDKSRQNIYRIFILIMLLIICVITIFANILLGDSLFYTHHILTSILSGLTIYSQILIQNSFTPNIKARMCSLSHSIGGIIFSSSAPAILSFIWLYSKSLNNILLFILSYFILIFILIFILQKENIKAK